MNKKNIEDNNIIKAEPGTLWRFKDRFKSRVLIGNLELELNENGDVLAPEVKEFTRNSLGQVVARFKNALNVDLNLPIMKLGEIKKCNNGSCVKVLIDEKIGWLYISWSVKELSNPMSCQLDEVVPYE